MDRKGKNAAAPAMLNMLPKFELELRRLSMKTGRPLKFSKRDFRNFAKAAWSISERTPPGCICAASWSTSLPRRHGDWRPSSPQANRKKSAHIRRRESRLQRYWVLSLGGVDRIQRPNHNTQ